jgi:hypothetical protein
VRIGSPGIGVRFTRFAGERPGSSRRAPAAVVVGYRRRMPKTRLFGLSFLMLFVELALIRWTGSNVVYLSYFSNFVLLGSFLGIGIGFLRAGARRSMFLWAPVALFALVAFVKLARVQVDRTSQELLFFGSHVTKGLPSWLVLPLIFVIVAVVMATIADGVARAFSQFEPLVAYRIDILGSIAGIAAFSLLSFVGSPPVVWGIVAGAVLLALQPRAPLTLVRYVAVVGVIGVLLVETLTPNLSWSPYYKIKTVSDPRLDGIYQISVNGIPHQAIDSVEHRERTESVYVHPYERIARPPGEVLIVGAGNGTDVAIALAHGATRVDAVEIDPRLQKIGKALHPNHPYDDPRVHVHIDDGRAFLERATRKWDLILFALPDSLTLIAGQSSLRLESYLFTIDAMKAARAHLTERGAFAMYNYYREQWLVDRLAFTLQTAFGHPPCIDQMGQLAHLAALTIGMHPEDVTCAITWSPAAPPVKPATDDHPFVYLRTRTIPPIYLVAIALILVASLGLVRGIGGRFGAMRPYKDLFFMGAAFLLLETKNVVQFALLFGTTWFVNALVFGGILLAVLAAIEIARRVRLPRPGVLYALLFATLAVSYAIPAHALLKLAFAPRLAAASAIAFAPITLANLIFAQRFKATASSTIAFGANLLGAMLGGVLEYASLIVGYRNLLIGVAVVYALALATTPRGDGSERLRLGAESRGAARVT